MRRPAALAALAAVAALVAPALGAGSAHAAAPSGTSGNRLAAAVTPPSGSLDVRKVGVKGSGCSGDSAAIAASPDNSVFTVTYSAFIAEVGPDKGSSATRSCSLTIKAEKVKGYTFAIARVDTRGYANLATGARLSHSLRYSMPSAKGDTLTRTVSGPFADDWIDSREYPTSGLEFGNCNAARNLTVDEELTVDAGTTKPTASSFASLDSTDVGTSVAYRLSWKAC